MKPIGGMFLDCAPADQPSGTYRRALNIVLNRLKDAVAVEGGTSAYFSVPTGYVPVASVMLDADSVAVLSTDFAGTTAGEIGIYSEITKVYTTFYASATLGLSLEHPIKMISYRNYRDDRIIVWTDNNISPKIYNFDHPFADASMMDLFPEVVVPEMAITVAEASGNLLAGSYYFAIAYEMSDGFVTDYLSISNPIPIFTPEIGDNAWQGGGTPGVVTAKGVKLALTDMDTRYDKFRVAIVAYSNGVYTAYETPSYALQATTEVTITGIDGTTDILLEDVTINRANYATAKTLTYENRKLYMGGLTTTPFPDYQQYANDIQVTWTYDYMNNQGSPSVTYKNGDICVKDKAFMPGEVYAFYISWILNDGSYTDAFHIPGRVKRTINPRAANDAFSEDISIISLGVANGFSFSDVEMDLYVNGAAKYFQMRDTSTVAGDMSYWENEELYPTGFPDLAGLPIRHHKFPTLASLWEHGVDPITNPTDSESIILGIKLMNVPIPASIADLVQGFEIFYAKRSYSNSIVNGMTYLLRTSQTDAGSFMINPILGTSTRTWRIFAPDLQKNGETPAISANYLRLEGEIEVDSTIALHSVVSLPELSVASMVSTGLSEPYRPIIAINTAEYDPFTPDEYRESAIEIKSKVVGFWTYTAAIGAANYLTMPATICSYRVNCYAGLSSQQLVGTGKQFFTRDSASYFPGVDGDGVDCLFMGVGGYSPAVFGGDTYMNKVYHFKNHNYLGGVWKQYFGFVYYSYSNLDLRVKGTDYGERFMPESTYGTSPVMYIDYDTAPSGVMDPEYTVDNYLKVYDDYSKSGELNMVYPYARNDINVNDFPNRIISSKPIQAEDNGGTLRKFLPLDYYEMPKNRGPITNLEGFNGMLLIHTEDSLYKTVGKVQLQTDAEAVVIGSGDIFDIEPTEIFTVPNGYAGCRNPYAAIVSKAGYFFIDEKAAKMFMMRESLEEISNTGLRNFFEENLQFQLVKDLNRVLVTNDGVSLFTDTPFSPYGVGYAVAFDDRYLRLIITKRDFTTIVAQESNFNTLYKLSGGYVCDKATSTPQTLAVLSTYLTDNSFTISYDIASKRWASFHSYLPVFLFNTKKNFYGSRLGINRVYRFNEDHYNGYYMGQTLESSWIDVTLPDKNQSQSVTSSISWTSGFLDAVGNPDFYKTWDRLCVYNTHQVSGWRTIDSAGASRNARFTGGRWHFNDFRDMTTVTGTIPPVNSPVQENYELLVDSNGDPVNVDSVKLWNKRKRFIDTYCIIRLEHTNTNAGIVYLYDLETSGRPVVR
jgi:hypothetical protein